MKKFWRTDQQAEKKKRQSNRTRQKNKRGDSKVESNESPEIPYRGETSDIPGLPSGAMYNIKREKQFTQLVSEAGRRKPEVTSPAADDDRYDNQTFPSASLPASN